MTIPCRFLLVALVLLPCAGAQPSGTNSGAVPQSDQTATSSQPPAIAFSAPEGLLHIDIVVANPAGSPVTGLPAADFSLLDNGQPAKIVSFHAYSVAFPPHPPVDITLLLDTFQVPRELETIEHEQLEDFLRQNGGQLPQPISLLILNDSGLWQAGPPSLDGNILADAIAHNRVTRWGRGAWVSGTNQSSIAANRGTIDAFSTAQPPPLDALQASARSLRPNVASPAENSSSGSVQAGVSPAATAPTYPPTPNSRSRRSLTTSPGSPPSSASRASAFAASLRCTRTAPRAGKSNLRRPLPTSPRSPCIRLPRPSMQPPSP